MGQQHRVLSIQEKQVWKKKSGKKYYISNRLREHPLDLQEASRCAHLPCTWWIKIGLKRSVSSCFFYQVRIQESGRDSRSDTCLVPFFFWKPLGGSQSSPSALGLRPLRRTSFPCSLLFLWHIGYTNTHCLCLGVHLCDLLLTKRVIKAGSLLNKKTWTFT